MKHATSSDELIEIRGRIYARHPSYDRCRSAKDGTAFKTLLGLADEAVNASNMLAQMVEAGHPLHSTLSGMDSSEAITYLLGVTHKHMVLVPLDSGDKPLVLPSDLPRQPIEASLSARKNEPVGESSDFLPGKSLDLDDETFDAFSSFSVPPG